MGFTGRFIFVCLLFTLWIPLVFLWHKETPKLPRLHPSTVLPPPSCNNDPCVIRNNQGGNVGLYKLLAIRLRKEHRHVQIAGTCYSSCSILADMVRPNVCLQPDAAFYIHQTMRIDKEHHGHRVPIRYSPDIMRWINEHGGEPTNAFLIMQYDEALRFWPACSGVKQHDAALHN